MISTERDLSALNGLAAGSGGVVVQDDPVNFTVRQLAAEDAEAAWQLGFEAFGVPSPPPPGPATLDLPGRTWFGAFVDDSWSAG